MLRKHIDKERDIVFPLAESVLSPEDKAVLDGQFEEIESEQGVDAHQEFEDIVESLERRGENRISRVKRND
jgi:hemerythrin-like domain-containing protein